MKTFVLVFISFCLVASAVLTKEKDEDECSITVLDAVYSNKQIIISYHSTSCEIDSHYDVEIIDEIGPFDTTFLPGVIIIALSEELCYEATIFVVTLDENGAEIGRSDPATVYGDVGYVEDLSCIANLEGKVTCKWNEPKLCANGNLLSYRAISYNGHEVEEHNTHFEKQVSFYTESCSDSWFTVIPVYGNIVGVWSETRVSGVGNVENLFCYTNEEQNAICNRKKPVVCSEIDSLTYDLKYFDGVSIREVSEWVNEEYKFPTEFCSISWIIVRAVLNNSTLSDWMEADAC